MSADARTHIRAGLALGLNLDALRNALEAERRAVGSQPTLAPSPGGAGDTVAWLEDHREDEAEHAVTLPTTPAVPPDTGAS